MTRGLAGLATGRHGAARTAATRRPVACSVPTALTEAAARAVTARSRPRRQSRPDLSDTRWLARNGRFARPGLFGRAYLDARNRFPHEGGPRLDTVARSAHRDYADIWWQWSLRDDGSAWYRLARVWYWRPVPHTARRREPPLWRLVAQLDAQGAAGQAAAAELLATVARGHGHYPAGSEPQPPGAGRLAVPAVRVLPARRPRRGAASGFARALRMIFVGVTDADIAEAAARDRERARARSLPRPGRSPGRRRGAACGLR